MRLNSNAVGIAVDGLIEAILDIEHCLLEPDSQGKKEKNWA